MTSYPLSGQGQTRLPQQLRRLVQGQAHDAGMAAYDMLDEQRGAALDAVGAGLVIRYRRRAIGGDRGGGHHAGAD